MSTRIQMHALKLVYPPISNFEAEQIKTDENVRKCLKQSNLYMLARRREVLYDDATLVQIGSGFSVDLLSGDDRVSAQFSCDALRRILEVDAEDVHLRLGQRILRLDFDQVEHYWATPAKLLFDAQHHPEMITMLGNCGPLLEFELLYVGISKKRDAYERLLAQAHEKRLAILSTEYPIDVGARTTDELILLFFRIEPLGMVLDAQPEDFAVQPELDYPAIIADAEKAFASLLAPRHNDELYHSYPKGTDGLYARGIDRYGFTIGEAMTLVTESKRMRGSFSPIQPFGDLSDSIFVFGDQVEFLTHEQVAERLERDREQP